MVIWVSLNSYRLPMKNMVFSLESLMETVGLQIVGIKGWPEIVGSLADNNRLNTSQAGPNASRSF